MFIMSCTKILIRSKQSNEVFRFSLSLFNFMSNTSYLQNPVKNAKDTKHFIRQNGRYENIITCDKGTLEQKTPIDLYKYVSKYSNHTNKWNPYMDNGHARYLFESFFTPKDKRDDVFMLCFKQLLSIDISLNDSNENTYTNLSLMKIIKYMGRVASILKIDANPKWNNKVINIEKILKSHSNKPRERILLKNECSGFSENRDNILELINLDPVYDRIKRTDHLNR